MDEQRITLREFIDSQFLVIHRDLSRLASELAERNKEHEGAHQKDSYALEIRMKEHQASHDREHAMRDLRDKENEEKLNIRLHGMNDMREQINQQGVTFMRNDTAEGKFNAQGDRLSNLEKWRAATEGRGGGASQTIGYIALGISMLSGIVALFLIFSGGG